MCVEIVYLSLKIPNENIECPFLIQGHVPNPVFQNRGAASGDKLMASDLQDQAWRDSLQKDLTLSWILLEAHKSASRLTFCNASTVSISGEQKRAGRMDTVGKQ